MLDNLRYAGPAQALPLADSDRRLHVGRVDEWPAAHRRLAAQRARQSGDPGIRPSSLADTLPPPGHGDRIMIATALAPAGTDARDAEALERIRERRPEAKITVRRDSDAAVTGSWHGSRSARPANCPGRCAIRGSSGRSRESWRRRRWHAGRVARDRAGTASLATGRSTAGAASDGWWASQGGSPDRVAPTPDSSSATSRRTGAGRGPCTRIHDRGRGDMDNRIREGRQPRNERTRRSRSDRSDSALVVGAALSAPAESAGSSCAPCPDRSGSVAMPAPQAGTRPSAVRAIRLIARLAASGRAPARTWEAR